MSIDHIVRRIRAGIGATVLTFSLTGCLGPADLAERPSNRSDVPVLERYLNDMSITNNCSTHADDLYHHDGSWKRPAAIGKYCDFNADGTADVYVITPVLGMFTRDGQMFYATGAVFLAFADADQDDIWEHVTDGQPSSSRYHRERPTWKRIAPTGPNEASIASRNIDDLLGTYFANHPELPPETLLR
jgi:hypothetical protein